MPLGLENVRISLRIIIIIIIIIIIFASAKRAANVQLNVNIHGRTDNAVSPRYTHGNLLRK